MTLEIDKHSSIVVSSQKIYPPTNTGIILLFKLSTGKAREQSAKNISNISFQPSSRCSWKSPADTYATFVVSMIRAVTSNGLSYDLESSLNMRIFDDAGTPKFWWDVNACFGFQAVFTLIQRPPLLASPGPGEKIPAAMTRCNDLTMKLFRRYDLSLFDLLTFLKSLIGWIRSPQKHWVDRVICHRFANFKGTKQSTLRSDLFFKWV